MKKQLASLALLGLFASCTSTPAEVATYDAIAPQFVAYVQADPKLTPQEVQRKLDLVTTWGLRVGRVVPK